MRASSWATPIGDDRGADFARLDAYIASTKRMRDSSRWARLR
jgi:hypothetical protein